MNSRVFGSLPNIVLDEGKANVTRYKTFSLTLPNRRLFEHFLSLELDCSGGEYIVAIMEYASAPAGADIEGIFVNLHATQNGNNPSLNLFSFTETMCNIVEEFKRELKEYSLEIAAELGTRRYTFTDAVFMNQKIISIEVAYK